jgi:hypothetical protein
MECHIRRAQREDAEAISRIVIAALRASNSQDYPAEVIAQVEQRFSPATVSALLDSRVVFVAVNQDDLLGTRLSGAYLSRPCTIGRKSAGN